MKTNRVVSGVMLLMAILFTVPLDADAGATYEVDPVHSTIIFSIRHFGVGNYIGRFNDPSGTVVFDENTPENSVVDIRVEAINVDTANAKRDQHLKSPDFFNVDKFPLISFKSRTVKRLSDRRYEVTGDLTLLGKTRPLTIQADHIGSGEDPWGGIRSGFQSTFTIRRSDFGMSFMMGQLGDEVDITVSIEGVRK